MRDYTHTFVHIQSTTVGLAQHPSSLSMLLLLSWLLIAEGWPGCAYIPRMSTLSGLCCTIQTGWVCWIWSGKPHYIECALLLTGLKEYNYPQRVISDWCNSSLLNLSSESILSISPVTVTIYALYVHAGLPEEKVVYFKNSSKIQFTHSAGPSILYSTPWAKTK